MNPNLATASAVLEPFEVNFNQGKVHLAMRSLVDGLKSARDARSPLEWRRFVRDIRAAECIRLAYRCPFTDHAYTKPAGYPGDANLIDHIYGLGEPPTDDAAQRLYAFTTGSPACRAVRFRRAVIAQSVDRVLHAKGGEARILAVASGHLREAEMSRSLRVLRPESYVAFDRDQRSLELVERLYGSLGVTPIQGDVKDLIKGDAYLGEFDLIYAAGLYDYLNQEAAIRLTSALFEALRPGGSLLVANFLPGIPDVGYMEAIMDWWLVFRDAAGMRGMCARAIDHCHPPDLFRDPDNNVIFMHVYRPDGPGAGIDGDATTSMPITCRQGTQPTGVLLASCL